MSEKQNERRCLATNFEIETREDGSTHLKGVAAVFDVLSENLGGFREQIAPGAFDDVMDDDVRALFNHNDDIILGRTKSETLSLAVNSTGLTYAIDLPDTQAARDLSVSVGRGDVDQSSFGFIVEDDMWTEDDEGRVIRTIRKIKRLFDVSPVVFPAYPDTSVATRKLNEYHAQHDEQKSKDRLGLRKRQTDLINMQNRSS